MKLTNQTTSFEIRTASILQDVSNATTATGLAQQIMGMANRTVHFDVAREVAAELLSGRYTGGQLRRWGINVVR